MTGEVLQQRPQACSGLSPPCATIPNDWPKWRVALYWQLLRNYIDTWPMRLYDELVVDCSTQFPDTYLVSDPAIIRDVFRRGSDEFQTCPQQRKVCTSLFGGPSIATSEGDDWAVDRANYEQALNADSLASANETINANAARLVENWAARPGPVRIDNAIARFALANIARLALGWNANAALDGIADEIDGVRSSVGRISLAALMQKLEFLRLNTRGKGAGALVTLEHLVMAEIAARRSDAAKGEGDLLNAYLALPSPTGDTEAADRRACSNVLAFIAAGFDTTASALGWFLYLLALARPVQDRVRDELTSILAQATPPNLAKLPYTRAVLSETLRLYPPLPLLARTSVRDYQFGSIAIAAGSNIFVSPYLVHRHRRLWESPDQFEPERFLGARRKDHAAGAYIPFGAGRRSCVGMQLAYREIVIAAALILNAFDLAVSRTHPVRVKSGMGLRAADGISLYLSRRD